MPPRLLEPEAAPTATIMTLAHHACRWPIGDPQDAAFGYCGRSRGQHASYCEDHAWASKPERSTRRTEADLIRQFDRVANR